MKTPATYSQSEIRWLLEDYEELAGKADTAGGRLLLLLKLADLHVAVRKLSPIEQEAVMLCGVMNMTSRAAGMITGKGKTTMNNHYRRGIQSIQLHLNGSKHAIR
jgi:DNA-directed RNA polymerase specialized sigma24 family protein